MEWDFNGYVDSSYLSGARLKIRFNKFAHKPDILEVVKWYVHHQLIINKFSTAKRNYDGITMFIKFVDECMPDLESFSGVSQELLIMYLDRKSTRLNSSHVAISYAVFCLKNK